MSTPIPIVGLGLVSSLGAGTAAVYDRMLNGDVGIQPLTHFDASSYAQANGGEVPVALGATLEAAWPDDDAALRFIKGAANEALGLALGTDPAAGAADPAVPADPQLGLVLATNFGLMETLEWCWRERLEAGEMDAETFALQQDVTARVAAWAGAAGPRAQLSLSCASGAAALDLAREWLLAGRATRVLVLCYDALTEFCWCGLSNLRTITTDALRPFDTERAGTIFSEGAAAMLLSRRPEDATAAVATLLGAATNNNAFHLTAPPKGAAGSRRVMAAALAEAGLAASAVDLVSAHATGTTANDVTESAAIADLGAAGAPVAAFKGNLGHMLGAAGLAEAVIGVEAARRGSASAVAGLREFDTACPVSVIRGGPRAGSYRTVLTNSAGIGGNNASVVLGLAGGVAVAGGGAASSGGAYASARSGPDASAPPSQVEPRLVASAWVLPGGVGSVSTAPADPGTAALAGLALRNAELADFKVKPYIQSVKGYLDPAGAFTLAAASLALQQGGSVADPESTAIVCCTRYGAAHSGYLFYSQLLEKGSRFASPMIFPHSYSNTAPNLVAIEFGFAGPHLVFDRAESPDEAFWAAVDLLRRGRARDVLLLAYEAAPPAALPDGMPVLHGAVCLWLTADSTRGVACPELCAVPPPAPLPAADHVAGSAAVGDARGCVAALLNRPSR